MAPPDSQTPDQKPGNGHLRALLLDTGVGSRWSTRDLARGGLSHMTWYRLTGEPKDDGKPYLCDWDTLPVVAKTLRDLGSDITLQQIQQAYLLDKGNYRSTGYDTLKSGVAQADAILGVITGLPDASQLQLLEDLVPFLPQHLRLQLLHTLAAIVAAEAAAVEKREGEQHDDDGSGLHP